MAVDIPPVDIWSLLLERTPLPYPEDQVLFRSSDPGSPRPYTFEDVRTNAEKFGKALKTHWGWNKGDGLIVMAPNTPEVPWIMWGCHWAGGVVIPVNPGATVNELSRYIEDSGAKGIVLHPQCLGVGREASQVGNLSRNRIITIGDASNELQSVGGFIEDTKHQGMMKRAQIDPERDLAYLVFSSGTTGRPKGVMITHRNVVSAVILQSVVEGPNVNKAVDKILATLPIYHIYGLICLVHLPVWHGIQTILMDRFDLETFCKLIEKNAITLAYVAPPIVLHLAKNTHVRKYNLSSVRMITSGGAPLAPGLIREVKDLLGIPVRQAYGLSETTSVSHVQRWDNWQSGIGSNGPPLPGLEVKFIRGDLTKAKTEEEGELCIRGPTVFKGYFNGPTKTAECLGTDGWFRTGDIGYEDVGDNLFITDRAKDMIKFKGYQIAPVELEDILLTHAAVRDSAVIGVINPDLQSEVPVAYIELKNPAMEGPTMAQELLGYVKERTTHYKRLRGGIIWISQIPKSPSGKILKRVLRDRVAGVDSGKAIGATEYRNYRKPRL